MSLILANEVVYGFFGAARMRLGSVCNRNCSSVLGRVLVSLKARQSCEKVKAKGPDNLGRPAVRRDRSAASECFGAMFRSLSGLLIRFDCAADNGIFKPQKVKEFPDLFSWIDEQKVERGRSQDINYSPQRRIPSNGLFGDHVGVKSRRPAQNGQRRGCLTRL